MRPPKPRSHCSGVVGAVFHLQFHVLTVIDLDKRQDQLAIRSVDVERFGIAQEVFIEVA
jgi:hypothetical protein